jgi:hypothetical protein
MFAAKLKIATFFTCLITSVAEVACVEYSIGIAIPALFTNTGIRY